MSYSNFQQVRKMDYTLHEVNPAADYTVRTGTDTYNFIFDNPVVVRSPAAAITLTVPDGAYPGQTLLIVTASNSEGSVITISVSHHVTEDPETFTITTVNQWLLLVWTGNEWVTLGGDATAP